MSIDAEGVVSIAPITEAALIGTHTVEFKVYLKNFDPHGVRSKPLDDFTLSITINP